MSRYKFAIDLGGSSTKIYKRSNGLVLNEPSYLAVSGDNGNYKIKSIGEQAKEMLGKTDSNTTVFSPIIDGRVKSVAYATEMLKYFLQKVVNKNIFKPSISGVVSTPCGLSIEEKKDILQVCYNCHIKSVKLVPSVITSALGGGKFVHTPTTYFIVDIGGSKTDIATVNLNTIVNGITIGIGGKAMDVAVSDCISENYKTFISMQTAESVKEEIGTLFEQDTQNMEVIGVDCDTKSPKSILVLADIIKEALIPYFEKIAFAVETTLNSCSPEISADIAQNGIFFCGGVSQITGLEDFMRKRLKLPIHIIEDAGLSNVLGAGKLLSDETQLDYIVNEF